VGLIFKDANFSKMAKKAGISDQTLRAAIGEADKGLVDAYLGSECIKIRLSRPGRGKSGGFRSVIAFRRDDRAFFIHLFAKNDQANVSAQDLADLRVYARVLLGLTDAQLENALAANVLMDISDE
jgi:hypothetical protein